VRSAGAGSATPRTRAGSKPRATRTSKSSGDLAAIRAWASSNGYSVGARGRIPAEIREAYAAAN
jgi:hypothetical protein